MIKQVSLEFALQTLSTTNPIAGSLHLGYQGLLSKLSLTLFSPTISLSAILLTF